MRKFADYARSFAGWITLGASLLLPSCALFNGGYSVSEISVRKDHSRVYFGSEEEAIRRMMDAAVNEENEDAWLAVYEPNGKTYFVDVGNPIKVEHPYSHEKNTRPGVKIQDDVVEKVLSGAPNGTTVRFYHTHPQKAGNAPDLYCGTMPSEGDFSSDTLYRAKLETKNSVHVLPSRVVGPRGFSEYVASGEGMKADDIISVWCDGRKYIDALNFCAAEIKINLAHFFALWASGNRGLNTLLENMNESGLTTTYTNLRVLSGDYCRVPARQRMSNDTDSDLDRAYEVTMLLMDPELRIKRKGKCEATSIESIEEE